MEALENISIALHEKGDDACPFCPGKEEKKWKTYQGQKNSSKILRECMNKPEKEACAQQAGARPKDGTEERQSKDDAKPSPNPIFSDEKYGDYSDQAHHAISGNEIMKGHRIEKVITKGGLFTGDTGYTINNCANGVYLPAYPKKYRGIWGKRAYPKSYPAQDGSGTIMVNNLKDDKNFKLNVMKPAMDSKGQAHIGNHKGHYIEELEKYNKTYPQAIKRELNAIIRRVINKGKECPFCTESDGTKKKPYLPPYKVNQWLDNLSVSIEKKLTASPGNWPYFISEIARDYFKEIVLPEDNEDFLG